MDDDDDFRTAPVLQCFAGAFLEVDGKAGLFQHGSARDTVPKLLQFLFLHYFFRALSRPPFCPDSSFPQFAGPFPAAAKSKGGKGAAGNLLICRSTPTVGA
ncbi:hypothetical protein SB748_27765 [Rhizobium sp. SIMBA_035]